MTDTGDDYLDENLADLRDAVVGHRIVKAEMRTVHSDLGRYGAYDEYGLVITLDNGKEVVMCDTSDCCAYTGVNSFLMSEGFPNHVITSVRAENNYFEWFILAEGIPVMTLDVGWSEGSGYYSYGFSISVRDLDA